MSPAWRALAFVLVAVPGLLAAQPPSRSLPPPIVEIAFEGNEVTQPRILLRELAFRVGDPAEPEKIEAGRQALLDLGLFKRVELRQEPVPGGVRLVYKVRERYYFLPTPRFDAKSDGQYSYGAQVRWSNLFGLNHSARLFWEQEDRQREGIGKETTWSAGYSAPLIGDSPYSIGAGAGYTTRPVSGSAGDYEEEFRSAAASLSRTWSAGAASQGWTFGGGLLWQQQRTAGPFAPAAYGEALAPRVFGGHRDLHYRIYSESGQAWGLNYEQAVDGWGSDYDYSRLGAGYVSYLPLGSTPHQTLHLIADTGLYFDGPPGVRQYALGGASRLRGYDASFIEGNAYWYASAELARPLFRPWLRAVLLLEAGSVSASPDTLDGEVYGSLGIGLRLRFTNFVNFELEAGFALPLDGGDARFFASRV